MTGIVEWAASRARMVLAFIAMSITAGLIAYIGLPKEGEPDIEIPALFVSVPFPGISAQDSETLLVKVMESELSDIDGLDEITGTAAENYGGVAMLFEFGWDKTKVIADVRDAMNTAEAKFPAGADKYTINEINFSEFPIIVVNLSGPVPERTLLRLAKELQDRLESLEPVLEASLTGHRDEMLEVVIDPLRLEAYNVTGRRIDRRGAQQQPVDRGGRYRNRDRGVFGQDTVVVQGTAGCLQPAGQEERRPGGDPGRTGRHPPDIRGPAGHRAVQRRNHGRAAGGQAQGLQHHRHLGAGATDPGRGAGGLARRSARGGERRHLARSVGAGGVHGQSA